LAAIPATALTNDQFIQYLKDKGFANEYIVYAQNHLKTYKNYSSAQLDTLKMYIDSTLAIVMPKNPEVVTKGASYFDKNKFINTEEDQILDNVVKAAAALKIRTVITRGPNSVRYAQFYTEDGRPIGSVTPDYFDLKYTNETTPDVSVFVVSSIILALILIVCAATLMAKRSMYAKRVV
jgi:hypothetical protein